MFSTNKLPCISLLIDVIHTQHIQQVCILCIYMWLHYADLALWITIADFSSCFCAIFDVFEVWRFWLQSSIGKRLLFSKPPAFKGWKIPSISVPSPTFVPISQILALFEPKSKTLSKRAKIAQHNFSSNLSPFRYCWLENSTHRHLTLSRHHLDVIWTFLWCLDVSNTSLGRPFHHCRHLINVDTTSHLFQLCLPS